MVKKCIISADRSSTRSSHYQNYFAEIASDPESIADCSEQRGVHGFVGNSGYKEDLLDLNDQLREEFWNLVDKKLTIRQKEVLHLLADGLTQMEVARLLGVNQSSITKSVSGNADYRNGKKKCYGGSRKKILKIIEKESNIKEILQKIRDIE